MNSIDKLRRARIQLQSKNPFFAYLVLNLTIKEEKKIPSCAVDNYNNLYYNPDWINKLTDNQTEMLLCHEVMHIAFQHLVRNKQRDSFIFNMATDICINNLLEQNNFEMIKDGLVPHNNEIKIQHSNITIKDINSKSAEYIYDEIYSQIPKTKQFVSFVNDNRIDEHRESDLSQNGQKGKDGKKKGLTPQQIKGIKESADRWKKLLTEASTYAKQRGTLPNGIDRAIDGLLNEKVNWKYLLWKYITNELPFDYSYAKPSRRSQATGIYMPYMKRESIDIMVSVDTSGSISQKDLTEFMTEIVSISKSFNNVKITAMVCDCEIQEVVEVRNGNISKLLDLKMSGGGGTSHIPIYEKIREEYPNTKFLISFTDGYTDFPETELVKTIWVLPKNSNKEIPYGEIIEL